MTVMVVGVSEGEELERLRSRIQRNSHFQVISHARTPDVALAHARVLLPDITVLTLAGGFRDDPVALDVFHGVRALDPPSGVVLRTRAGAAPGDLDSFTADGAVHIVRAGDEEGLMRALRTIGLRRASCDPDEMP
ncbi:hypothetical protein SLAV_37230 [Streptomyces lavendulae subsp. lavendulae]|uniref:Uncharacterized protein n=2 Tax=Streptomyces lavendulae TaxID=1914 RepID=A0A2K8PR43_STRLA|nr:hypothetical protein [Streptomyces lavendulae]ATZ29211.1 hypothetical protein SLAV_37230 [Streptomyces lavendulae subsp. lavendulae]QUQ59027.1 hypothetical protein SLLC_35390 [Streptomyces lavendulae subsp. lavendulae]